MQTCCIPVSAVIATRDRAQSLRKTLNSLLLQRVIPAEVNVIDASADKETMQVMTEFSLRVGSNTCVRYDVAATAGAAPQRNQGVTGATQPFIWFFDDDIRFEPDCVKRLWQAMQSDEKLGGVNAMIVNQRYQPPGAVSRTMFTILNGRRENTFAGRVIGPAVNLLPEERDDLPEVVPVEWLNTTCTMYRREVLPSTPFDSVFTGYSLMEDLTLSLRVARNWRLANARTARIFHDSQPGNHKADPGELARMELVNRHYVMTKVLGRSQLRDYARLFLWENFQLLTTAASSKNRKALLALINGKLRGLQQIR